MIGGANRIYKNIQNKVQNTNEWWGSFKKMVEL